MIFCTSVCANYLPKAMVLAESLKKHNPNSEFVVCLVEKTIEEAAEKFEYFDYVVLSKDIGIRDFDNFIFRHTIVEASTAVKGDLFEYLLNNFKDEDKFVYLDPDIMVYSSFSELDSILEKNEIVLTPHTYFPEAGEEFNNGIFLECNHLKRGVYNLGFLGIRRGEESSKFITWWKNRLNLLCYDEVDKGLFVDQKWIDLAPALFNVYILKEPGYNLAYWNLSKRNISIQDGKDYYANDKPLVFVHFSGWDSGFNNTAIATYAPNVNELIHEINKQYNAQLSEMDKYNLSKAKWSYNYFDNGDEIPRGIRIIYRNSEVLQQLYTHPFGQLNGELGEYLEGLYNIKDNNPEADKWSIIDNYINEVCLLDKEWKAKKRIELGILKLILGGVEKKCIIWGASNGGKIMKKVLDVFYEDVKIAGFIDKYKTGEFEGYNIYKPGQLKELSFDYAFIATSPGKADAEKYLKSNGCLPYKDYYSLF